MSRTILIAFLVVCDVATLPAPSRAVETTGVRASMGGARALALGGALVAVPGVDAAAQNPAALAAATYGSLQLDHRSLASGLARQSGVLALRPWTERDAVLAVRADIVRQSGIAAPEALSGAPRAVPGRAAWRATLAGAASIGRDVSAGIAFGHARVVPAWEDAEDGFVADAGFAWQRGGTRVALAASGIGMQAQAGAPDVALGAAQTLLQGRVFCTAQLERTHMEQIEPAGGVEVWAHRAVSVRAGARGGDEPTGAGGLGVHWDRVHLDYACSAQKSVGPVHALSLQFDLGSPAPITKPVARVKPVVEKTRAVESKPAAPVEKPAAVSSPAAVASPAPTPPAAPVVKPTAPAVKPTAPVVKPTAPVVKPPAPVVKPPAPVVKPSAPAAPAAPPAASTPAPASAAAPVEKPAVAPRPSFEPLLAPLPSATAKPAPAAPSATPSAPAAVEDTAPALYRVFTGPYPNLESLASDVLRLRGAGFYPEVERQGDKFLLVLRRGVSLTEAEKSVARVREQELRARFERQ